MTINKASASPTMWGRVLLAALACVAAMLIVPTHAAAAGEYDVRVCKAAPGNANNVMTAAPTIGGWGTFGHGNDCGGGWGLWNGHGGGWTGYSSGRLWRYTAPSGMNVNGFHWAGSTWRPNNWGPWGFCGFDTCFDQRYLTSFMSYPSGWSYYRCDAPSTPEGSELGDCGWSNGWTWVDTPNSDNEITFGVLCAGWKDGGPRQCSLDNSSPYMHITHVAIRVNDPANPTIGGQSGAGVDTVNWRRGTVSYAFNSTDAHSGTRYGRLSIDGAAYANFPQACDSNASSYSWSQPCSTGAVGFSGSINTAAYASGSHTVTLSAWDASGWDTWGCWCLSSSNSNENRVVYYDNTAPSAPSTVADGSAGNLTWTNSTNNPQSNWSGASDAHSGINDYYVCYSTGLNCSGTVVAQGWDPSSPSSGLTGTLVHGQLYYACVYTRDRAYDNAGSLGNTSGWACSNGQTADHVAPTAPGTVYGGASIGVDLDVQNATATLSGNWTAATDALSGIGDYQYCISATTNCGGTPVRGWTSDGADLTVNAASLALANNTVYYLCVRAVDNAGTAGAATCDADGIRIDTGVPVVTLQTPLDNAAATTWPSLVAQYTDPATSTTGRIRFQVCTNADTTCAAPTVEQTSSSVTSPANGSYLPSLADGTWRWRARAEDDAGNVSGWSAIRVVVVDGTAPTNPSQANLFDLSLTASNDRDWSSSTTGLSASWNAGADVGSGVRDYDVCFSSSSTGCTAIAGTTMQSGNTTRTASATATGMTPLTFYYVCVRTWDNAGANAGWQCSDGFRVETTNPGNPTQANIFDLSLTFAADLDWNTSATALSMSWNAGSDANSGIRDYDACFSTVNTGCTTIAGTSMVTANTTRMATATATGMTQGTWYYACVRTWDVAGNTAGWQCSDGFRVDSVAATNPAQAGIFDLSLTFSGDFDFSTSATALSASWNAATDATSGVRDYDACFSTSSSGCTNIAGTTTTTANTTRTASATATGMTSGTTYFVCVRSYDNAGNVAAWQCSDGFMVDTTAPTNPVQANVYDLSLTFAGDQDFSASTTILSASWAVGSDAQSGVRDYDACFSTVSTGCTPIAGTAMQTANTTRTATAVATGMAHGTTYYSCVRTWDVAGQSAGWRCSDGFTIDTQPPPAVTTLAITSPTSTLSLTWTTVADAGSGTAYYRVFRSTASGTLGSQVNADGATTSGSYVDPAALPAGTYWYTVQAVDAVGNAQVLGNNQVTVLYVAPLYLRSNPATNLSSAWKLELAPGAAADTATKPKVGQGSGYVQFEPGLAPNSPTFLGSLPASPNGRGWTFEQAAGTSHVAGTWRLHVTTDASRTHTGYVNVRLWKVTTSAGAIQTSTPLSGWVQGTTDVGAVTGNQSHFVDVAMPQVSFAAGEHLYVEYWEHITVAASGGGSTNTTVTFQANTSAERIVPTGPAPAMSVASTTPATIAQGRKGATIQVNGSGFVNGASVSLSGAGIAITNTSWVSATRIDITVDVGGAAALGARNVTVTNPDLSTATGTGVLAVVAPSLSISLSTLGYGDAARDSTAPHAIDFGLLAPGIAREIGPAASGQALAGAAVIVSLSADTDTILQASATTPTSGANTLPAYAWKRFGVAEAWTSFSTTAATIQTNIAPGSSSLSYDLRAAPTAGQLAGTYVADVSYTLVAAP